MKIILDAMGGDNAPEAPVLGAVEAAKTYGIEIVLVGRGEDVLAVLKKHGIDNLPEGMVVGLAAALALTSALPERAFVGEYERLFGTVSDEAAEPEKAG